MPRALWTGFANSAKRFPNRDAVWVDGRTISYDELNQAARAIAATLQAHRRDDDTPLAAVFADRTPTAFSGVLGVLLSGFGYVPLNPTFPPDRTRAMFQRSGSRAIVVDVNALSQLGDLLNEASETITVLLPEVADASALQARWPQHKVLGQNDFESAGSWREPSTNPDAIAYLLFTSGSTGIPKGVMVAHRNVIAFLDYMVGLYGVTEDDRFSQLFHMTFDLSVFDMFVCWEKGALLCCPSQKTLMKPGQFIEDMALTVWFSVPSTAIFMKQMGMLKAGRYQSLRLSLFCGEALPLALASEWRKAAPAAALENLYGPTELTIACTRYRWDDERTPQDAEQGVVPIGEAYPGMTAFVVNDELHEVGPGEEGELVVTGPQLTLGYWKDTDRTAAAFVALPGRDGLYYRTGDRVRRSAGDKPMTYLGRTDFQVKVFGHRIELGEVEAAIRTASGQDGVVAVGWPPTASGFGGIEAFIEGDVDGGAVRAKVLTQLPAYMAPRRLHVVDRLPRNVNDKFDRKALAKMLEEGL